MRERIQNNVNKTQIWLFLCFCVVISTFFDNYNNPNFLYSNFWEDLLTKMQVFDGHNVIMDEYFFRIIAWLFLLGVRLFFSILHSFGMIFCNCDVNFSPFSVKKLPDLVVSIIFASFRCEIKVLTAPSPRWISFPKVARLTNFSSDNNWRALNTCGILNVSTLLEPFLETIFCNIWIFFFSWFYLWIITVLEFINSYFHRNNIIYYFFIASDIYLLATLSQLFSVYNQIFIYLFWSSYLILTLSCVVILCT